MDAEAMFEADANRRAASRPRAAAPVGRPAGTRLPLTAAVSSWLALLGGCGALPAPPPDVPAAAVAPRWQAPIPAAVTAAPELQRWWSEFDDPLLATLVDAAAAVSPAVASASSRIEQARAARVASSAALLPSVDAGVSAARGRPDLTLPLGATANAGLQSSWELDVFGRNRASRDAAEARLAASESAREDVRVALAAETANAYVGLRTCEARLAQARLDVQSRSESARLTELSSRSGFESEANAALARASAAQAGLGVKQQSQQCELAVKALVALTAIAEPELRAMLAAGVGRLPAAPAIVVPQVPAAALAQRADIHAREQEVIAASADIARADDDRLPRVTLAGSLGVGRVQFGAGSFSGSTWSLGPIAVSLPVFDAGARRANQAAARASYEAAVSAYGGALRDAVRDVEDALVSLQGTADRQAEAQVAAESFEAAARAADARFRSGFGTLFELEDARRSALAAQNTLIDLRRERIAAWIALHRALGGGWSSSGAAEAAAPSATVSNPARP